MLVLYLSSRPMDKLGVVNPEFSMLVLYLSSHPMEKYPHPVCLGYVCKRLVS